MTLTRKLRIGLRREILILYPVAVLLLIVLCGFVLLSYRTAVGLTIQQRQEDAAEFAARVASGLPHDRRPNRNDLHRATTGARRAAIIRSNGKPLIEVGDFSRPPLAPIDSQEQLTIPIAIGPNESLPSEIAGFAAFRRGDDRFIVRVDLGAEEIAFQSRALRILTWVVLAISVGVAALVLLFSRHLLRPYETLLAQARRIGEPADDRDEMTFLTQTIEQALSRLIEPEERPDADIEALQSALGPSLESGFMLLGRNAEVVSINSHGATVLGAESSSDLEEIQRLVRSNATLDGLLSQAVAAGGHVQRREIEIEIGGDERTLGITVHPLRRDDGQARAYLTLFADLTEARRVEHEEKLTENLTQLGEMAAGVAHELRNSLATVRGYLTLIERRPEEESLLDYLQEMRRESDHLQRVVDDFLTFARPETKRLEDVELAEIARRAASDPALPTGKVHFEAPENALPTIRGDSQLLERAIKNLIHNAVRAQDDLKIETPVEVRASGDERSVSVSVEDLGGGLPEQVRARLFQPFVTSRVDGVGLGLTLARRIVSLHRGRLHLHDRPGGTHATIEFSVTPDKIE